MKNDLRRAIERSPRSKSWPKGLEAPCNENGETIQMGASAVALSEDVRMKLKINQFC
jgi:hypothetical protein